MGNCPPSLSPAHRQIFERVRGLKTPDEQTRIARHLLTKPDLVEIMRAHGLLVWIQRAAAAPPPPNNPVQQTAGPAAPAASAIVTAPSSQGGDQRLIEFEHEEDRREKAFKRESEKRRREFMQQLMGVTDETAFETLGIDAGRGVTITIEDVRRAYRSRILRVHPDKGGNEADFAAVTKAFKYLESEFEKRERATAQFDSLRSAAMAAGTAPAPDHKGRVAFGLLDPEKFNPMIFNQIFEATKINEEDEEGYEDWYRNGNDEPTAPPFSEAYNRDVFNRMFESHAAKMREADDPTAPGIPDELITASHVGHVVLGGGRSKEFTSAFGSGSGVQYTDLRKAFTEYNLLNPGEDSRGAKRQGRTTISALEAERAAALARPQTQEERAMEAMRTRTEVQWDRNRISRLQARDDAYATLSDQMKGNMSLEDVVNNYTRGSGAGALLDRNIAGAAGRLPPMPLPLPLPGADRVAPQSLDVPMRSHLIMDGAA